MKHFTLFATRSDPFHGKGNEVYISYIYILFMVIDELTKMWIGNWEGGESNEKMVNNV